MTTRAYKINVFTALTLAVFALTGILFLDKKAPAKETAPAKTPTCFTNTPDKYPLKAAASAPEVTLNPSADAVSLYAQLQVLTHAERLRFFGVLSDEHRTQVWLIHISNFVNTHSLDAEQQAVVDATVAFLKSKPYSQLKGSPLVKSLDQRARAAFGVELAWELGGHLGGKSPFGDNHQIANYVLPGALRYLPPACDCNTSADFCNHPDYVCIPNGEIYSCQESMYGCGWAWLGNCDGYCRYNIWR